MTTGQGKSLFAVLGVWRAGDPLPPALPRGQGRLTLVTTDGPVWRPTDVLRVDASLTSAAQPRPAQLPSQALRPAKALMAGDRSALLGVFGWSVLLVAVAIATVWVRFRAGEWAACGQLLSLVDSDWTAGRSRGMLPCMGTRWGCEDLSGPFRGSEASGRTATG